ncbi:AmmeMemoRadiSam system protein A [Shewanella corallii]|uniref:AmmeMemoRadiSam system protein A n=1 Tax=Shewanella corallii TaxID=560080 RepID=A0ABT0N4A4_9GAMM|nr:AmmeMemoRadiSam system protein A [Shewanella corallii]MCL2912925.1 AmmeMemoRadiSam system protein A [Shewanella corallii]
MSAISSARFSAAELSQLLVVARQAIATHFGQKGQQLPNAEDYDECLSASAGCFVTLEVRGELQGCIGTITSQQPLLQEVHKKALAAAFSDKRFPPLAVDQLSTLTLEVSVLSKPGLLASGKDQDCLNYLGRHHPGVILSQGKRRGVFLPQVWDKLKTPKEFVTALKRKAGISAETPLTELRVEIFNVDSHKEAYWQS